MMLNKKPLWAVTFVAIPILMASTGLFIQSNRLLPIDTSVPEAAKSDIDMQKKVRTRLGQTPMAFERNQGQTDTQVKFLSRGLGYALFLTPTEAVFKLEGASKAQGQGKNAIVRMALVGASDNPTMVGRDLQKNQSNHFRGQDPSRWLTNVNRYGKVEYSNVYPGVDLVYYGKQQQLEYDFIVAPGRDPRQIAVKFDGVQSRKLDAQGNLVLGTQAGELVQQKPLVYQDINGKRHMIDSQYQLLADNRIGFQIGRYDQSEPLVIDPIMEFGATFGGTLNDRAYSVAVDRAGYIYIAGMTVSDDFPTVGAIKPTKQEFSNNEAFVSKLNIAGNAFIYSTYFGGNAGGDDEIRGIAVDATGNVYITGITYSTAFPLVGAIQATKGSFADAFVTKINASGNALVYSTYLGGNSHDYGYGIAVNAAGEAYVVGTTQSTDFPTAAARQVANGGGGDRDAFVSKLNASGSAFVFSTYHGGAFSDYGYAIALDPAGNAYITGETDSTNFPLASAKQAVKGTFFDAFISKISANGNTLTYSTYLGGNDYDRGFGIAVDKTGAAYVTGETGSLNFPIFNAYQATKGLSTTTDAFITKYVPAGTAFAYSTYLGGSGHDYARAIAIDPAGNAYVTGDTRSNNFPVTAAMQP
ncbi:MAG: SBBP repeat-containing protein, partial [Arenimonas sp.]